MPGNLHGHGMGNVELSREEHYQEDHWDRHDHGNRGQGGGFRGRDRDWGGDRYSEGRGGRGGSDYRRDGRDWDRGVRDRREEDRGYRGRQRGRRDWEEDRRHERRDYRDRDSEGRRSTSRPHSESGSQGGGQGQRSDKSPVALPATEDWSDDEITEMGSNEAQTESLHKNVADELANFDKQFLPSKSEDKP